MAAQPQQAPTDVYGFRVELPGPQQLIDMQRQRTLYALHEKSWAKYVEKHKLPSGSTLKRLVREGIPPQLRSWVWMETSGAREMRAAQTPSYYSNLLRAQALSKSTAQVELVGWWVGGMATRLCGDWGGACGAAGAGAGGAGASGNVGGRERQRACVWNRAGWAWEEGGGIWWPGSWGSGRRERTAVRGPPLTCGAAPLLLAALTLVTQP